MVSVLDPEALHHDLTPVATAGEAFFDWLPEPIGLVLIVAAAVAAFASTGNAGLMSASRYPLAMARDRLVPDALARLGGFHTPVQAVVLTAGLMIFFIAILSESGIAKLASAAAVCFRKTFRNLDGELHGPFGGQRSAAKHPSEIVALVVRHGDERPPRLDLINLVDRADVEVIERRCGLRFVDESRSCRLIPRQLARQEL